MLRKSVLTIAMTLVAASVFAASTTVAVFTTSTLPGFQPSKSVSVGYQADQLTGTTYVTYAISAKHQSGDKIFGTDSATTKMFQRSGTAGTALATGDNPTLPTNATTSVIGSGWTSM